MTMSFRIATDRIVGLSLVMGQGLEVDAACRMRGLGLPANCTTIKKESVSIDPSFDGSKV